MADARTIERQKRFMAIFIAVIFIGSLAGLALYSGGSAAGGGSIDVPDERILPGPLSQNQKAAVISGYGVSITANVPQCGFECDEAVNFFESLTRTYQPFVFVYSDRTADQFFVIMEGASKTTTLFSIEEFDAEKFEDELCSNLHPSVNECRIRTLV